MAGAKKAIVRMTPDDRLQTARSRMQYLENYMYGVLTLTEHVSAIIAPESPEPKDEIAANAARFLRSRLANILTIEICGLYDHVDENGFSIPTLFYLLDDPLVLGLAEKDFPLNIHKIDEYGRNLSRNDLESVRSEFTICNDFIKNKLFSETWIIRLNQYRHKFIAHPLLITRDEKRGLVFERPEDVDLITALNTAQYCIRALSAITLGHILHYDLFSQSLSFAAKRLYHRLQYLEPEA